MPVQYSGIIDEHNAVRNAVGLFDVSHMGEIEIRGPEAAKLTDYVTTNAVAKLKTRPGALLRPALRARRLRRRHPGPQSRRRSLLPLRQRLQSGKGFRAHPRRTTASTPRWSSPATATRRSPSRVPRRWTTLQKLTPVDLAPSSTTGSRMAKSPARRRASRTPATPAKTASKSTFRPPRPQRIWQLSAGRRRGIRHQALRPGRAQHAAPGSQDGALRPRDRRLHHAARSRSGLDRQTRQGRFRRAATRWSSRRKQASRASWSGFEMRGRGIGRDGYEVYLDGAPAGWVTSGSPVAHAEQEHRALLPAGRSMRSPASRFKS